MTNEKKIAIAKAIIARKNFGFGTTTSIQILKKIEQEENFTVVYMPFDDGIDGFSSKRKNHYIIVLNSNCNINRRNFTCAHELYHLLFEYDKNDNYIGSSNSEKIANMFASYFLIPEDALYLYLNDSKLITKKRLTIKDIVNIENFFQVSRSAILTRLKDEQLISNEEFEQYSQNVIKSVIKSGNDPKNYIDPKNPEHYTLGEYNLIAKKLLNDEKISRGKYEEIMIDSFNYKEIFGDLGDL